MSEPTTPTAPGAAGHPGKRPTDAPSSRSLLSRLRPSGFGAEPSGDRLARVERSPQFRDGAFRNPQGAGAGSARSTLPLLRDLLRRADRVRRKPAGRLPVVHPSAGDLDRVPASGLRLTWAGHAGVIVDIDGHRLLFDPVWGERCSPVSFAGPKRLHAPPLPLGDLGRIDAVVISHDHYDHLDMTTVKALAGRDTVFAVPLGVGAHLEFWGVPAARIVELDWYESADVGDLTLTATPGQHFCGRGLRNQGRTLWASWAVTGPTHRVFHSGDTGYFPGFADIGARLGPFDATMMQIGAYSSAYWPDIHMTPEEGVQAHVDLSGGAPQGVFLPIHWGTFTLSLHPWEEPAERTVAEARRRGVAVALPRPGEPFEPAGRVPAEAWWREIAVRPAGGGKTAASLNARPAGG
ncbi:MBL fold metallo-hydrolase [Streptomyces avicenniae]|uniref:MBL fold metallo-hydrolase n=1 Tax=Streptomyces avicenniae TaxID=500153 RepID=UPI000AA9ADD1|nr:MBL fold metallo-hydrolase [Streptomyces avicenniae]